MKKEKLIKAIRTELMKYLPEGSQWREVTAENQAKALVEKFNVKEKRSCRKKDS